MLSLVVDKSWLKKKEEVEAERAVKQWLVARGWPHLVNLFLNHGISDLETLKLITQDDLKQLGYVANRLNVGMRSTKTDCLTCMVAKCAGRPRDARTRILTGNVASNSVTFLCDLVL